MRSKPAIRADLEPDPDNAWPGKGQSIYEALNIV
jgi:hypothetical protein